MLEFIDDIRETNIPQGFSLLGRVIKAFKKSKELLTGPDPELEGALQRTAYRLEEEFGGDDLFSGNTSAELKRNSTQLSRLAHSHEPLEINELDTSFDFDSLPPGFYERLHVIFIEELRKSEKYRELLNRKLQSEQINAIHQRLDQLVEMLQISAPFYVTQAVSIPKHTYEGVNNYIHRTVTPLDKQHIGQDRLRGLIEKENRLVLSGAGGNGKSTELLMLAAELSKDESPYYPVFIRLKHYTSENIESLLDREFTEWAKVPTGKLCLMFDGMDEIDYAHFNNFCRELNKFSSLKKYEHSIIIASCRTTHYITEVQQKTSTLTGYTTVVLKALGYSEAYAEAWFRLNRDFKEQDLFANEVKRLLLTDFTYIPFFLLKLIEIFKGNGCLPANREEAMDMLIDYCLDFEKDKLVNHSTDISGNELLLRNILKKVAFACQCSGKNLITNLDLQKLIPDKSHRDLIKHSFIFSRDPRQTSWEFDNSMIQEFLAARLLTTMDADTIISLASIDGKGLRVKPSWYRALTLTFSLLPGESSEFLSLLAWVKKRQPELQVTIEKTKIPLSIREEIFQSYYRLFESRGVIIASNFFDSSQLVSLVSDSHRMFQSVLNNVEQSDEYLVVSEGARMFQYFERNQGRQRHLKKVLLQKVLDENLNVEARGHCLRSLQNCELLSLTTIKKIIRETAYEKHQRLRIEILHCITDCNLVNELVDYLIECLLLLHKRDASHGANDGHMTIENAFRKLDNPLAIVKVLNFLIRDDQGSGPPITHSLEDGIFPKMLTNLSAAENLNDDFTDLFIEFLEERQYHHRRRKSEKEMESVQLVIKAHRLEKQVLEYMVREHEYSYLKTYLKPVLNNEHLRHLADLMVQYKYTIQTTLRLLAFFPGSEMDKRDQLKQLMETHYQEEIVFPVAVDEVDLQQKRHQQDIYLLRSYDQFYKEIEQTFLELGKEEPSYDELSKYYYQGEVTKSIAVYYLMEWAKEKRDQGQPPITRDFVLKDVKANWTTNRIHWLIEYECTHDHVQLEQEEREFIANWAKDAIPKQDFANTLYKDDDGRLFRTWHIDYISYFFMEGYIEIEDAMLLHMLTADWYKIPQKRQSTLNMLEEGDEPKSLSDAIIEQVGLRAAKAQIIENLRKGITISFILDAHLKTCGKHKIVEALPFLENLLTNGLATLDDTELCLSTYWDLGGKASRLLKGLNQFDYQQKLRILEKCVEQKGEVSKSLVNYYQTDSAELKDEFRVKALRLLIEAKAVIGLELLIKRMETQNRDVDCRIVEGDLISLPSPKTFKLVMGGYRLYWRDGFRRGRFDGIENVFRKYLSAMGSSSLSKYRQVKKLYQELAENGAKSLFSELNELELWFGRKKETPVDLETVSNLANQKLST